MEEGDTRLSNVSSAGEASPDMAKRKLKAQQTSTERFLQKFAMDEVYGDRGAKSDAGPAMNTNDEGTLPRFMIHPTSRTRLYWDVVAIVLVFYVAVTLPYRLAFARSWPDALVYLDFIADVYFMADIILNVFTAYYDEETLVVNRKQVLRHYLQTWFILDLIATFPVDWVVEASQVRPRCNGCNECVTVCNGVVEALQVWPRIDEPAEAWQRACQKENQSRGAGSHAPSGDMLRRVTCSVG